MGPGGEKKNHLGELIVKVRTEEHDGGDISSRVTFHGTKVRKPLLAVSGVIDKKATLWSSMGAEPLYSRVNALVLRW